MGDCPESGLKFLPWDITQTEALLINAFDFTKPRFNELIMNGWCPKEHLKAGERPIIIDSGAYYFVRKSKLDLSPEQILEIECKSQADLGVILDHPFTPESRGKRLRISRTLANTGRMLKHSESLRKPIELMPVIHGHSTKHLELSLKGTRRLLKEHGQQNLSRVGLGSIAPLAQRGNARKAVELIFLVRQMLPEAHMHCFSMGSPLLMLLAFYSGADSVDSQSWMVSAAFKYGQLPGRHLVRLGRKDYDSQRQFNNAKSMFADKIIELASTEHFIIKDWNTGTVLDIPDLATAREYVETLCDDRSNENVHNRACHNLWVFNWEVARYRAALDSDTLEEFLESRLRHTRHARALDKVRSLLNGRT